jgi:biopolymer transport protein ExbD
MSGGSNRHDEDGQIMAEINMTPLIDIMLVLLIIFMVTSSISLESGMDIELPQVGAAGTKEKGGAVIVTLEREGSVSVQGKRVELDGLQLAISEALKLEGTELVILEGDKAAGLGNAVNVMDIARTAGATKFAIAAESAKN